MSENHEVKLRYVKKPKNGKKETTKKPWPLPQGNLFRGIVNWSSLEPVCCKKRQEIVPDQLLVWE